jgi:hypothetical protein
MTRRPALSGKARQFSRGYLKIALVEVDPSELPEGEGEPRMISPHARGCVRVIESAQLYYGEGVRSEGGEYLRALEGKAALLNLQALA